MSAATVATTLVLPGAASKEERFEALLRSERQRAIRIAYHLTGGDRAMAEDLAQEAFLRAFDALPVFRGEAAMSSWFIRILLNQASSYRRRQWVRRRGLSFWRQDADEGASLPGVVRGGGAAVLPGDPGLRRRMAQALTHLSEGQRQAFSLVYLEAMTLAEAADVMGAAVGTVKSHLHRALTKLRVELQDLMEE